MVSLPMVSPARIVIRESHHQRLPVIHGKIVRHFHRVVEGDKIGHHVDRVICMARPVHLASLHHQEEAVLIPGEEIEGLSGHLGQ